MKESKFLGESVVYFITRINLDNNREEVVQYLSHTGSINYYPMLEDATPFDNLELAKGIKQTQELLAKITAQNVGFKILKQTQTTIEEIETTEQTSK